MTPVTLYHIPDWASSIIRLALEETGHPYRIKPMDWDAGDFDSPQFRAITPLGLIPAMETPDGAMFETVAILLWLNDRSGGLGPRAHEAGRARFLSWLAFVANSLHPTVMTLIHPDRVAGPEAATEAQRLALEQLNTQASHLETLIATHDPDWLSTRQTSALGYYLGILLRWTMYLPNDPGMRFSLRPFPRLMAVLAAHQATPAATRVAVADTLGPTPFTDPRPAA